MTAPQFRAWLDAMKESGLARHDSDCARLLGVSPHSVVAMKRDGVHGHSAARTALACRALLDGLQPYS